ncbi:MAG: hypothetical protein M3167_15410 [Acidobacteriota bacterium]|nr:hypothetical protein [Acidobacteriota bacterium]
MKKAIAIPLPSASGAVPSGELFLRVFLAGELLLSILLQSGGAIPPVAIRALQLFLRF